MSRSVFFTLLFVSILLPSPICSQSEGVPPRRHHHHHHSHLDTDPDLELSPVRPNYAMMTSRSPTMRDWIHLPTVPSFPSDLSLDNTDYEDSYDYNTQWTGESSGAAGTESQSTVAATEDEEDEYVDPFEGHRDHFKNGSSAVIDSWFLFFLPLVISMAALFLS